jgi:uncharacterized protein YkwD
LKRFSAAAATALLLALPVVALPASGNDFPRPPTAGSVQLVGVAFKSSAGQTASARTTVEAAAVDASAVHWLDRLNSYRATAGLGPVSEVGTWSEGARLHSSYLALNNVSGHSETPGAPGYSDAGAHAGINGNVIASSASSIAGSSAIDSWMAAPFHALGMIDPRLTATGFGIASEGASGTGIRSAATLDIIRGLNYSIPWPSTPIIWPANGTTVPIASYNGYEWPDPLTSCPATFRAPAGLPVMVMFPDTPHGVTASMTSNGQPVEVCVLSEHTYTNPRAGEQILGRSVLAARNAVIVMAPNALASGVLHSVTVSATSPTGAPMTAASTFAVQSGPFGGTPVWAELKPGAAGHWVVTNTGMVTAAGAASNLGGMAGIALARPVVAMQSTPSGHGYWLLASDGGIFTFGDAGFHGSAGAQKLSTAVVAMETTASGQGYWLVTASGQVLAFGDAGFLGDASHLALAAPIVDIGRTASGNGYWLVASDGGIFTYGDAVFHGSAGAINLAQPVVGLQSTGSGSGYWLVAHDGGIFTYGDAAYHGSAGATSLESAVRAMVRTNSNNGYWLLTERGQILAYGDAAR